MQMIHNYRLQFAISTSLLLSCLKLLIEIWSVNLYLWNNSSSKSALYFINQKVYTNDPQPLLFDEDVAIAVAIDTRFKNKVEFHFSIHCNQSNLTNNLNENLKNLPAITLDNIVFHKGQSFLYTRVRGVLPYDLLFELEKDRGTITNNLITLSKIFKSEEKEQFLKNQNGIFTFYFVRNPLDRVISGYQRYFRSMNSAKLFMGGVALKEIMGINDINPDIFNGSITFQQYINWIVRGASVDKYFGVQSNVIQPCGMTYSGHGIYELMPLNRLIFNSYIPELPIFVKKRNFSRLAVETRKLVDSIDDLNLMDEFYKKYEADYRYWDYSKPKDSYYPFPNRYSSFRLDKEKSLKLDPSFS